MNYVTSQTYIDPTLGEVVIKINAKARRFIARWRSGVVHITIPPYTTLKQYEEALAELTPRILAAHPQHNQNFYDGFEFSNDLWSLRIEKQNLPGVKSIKCCQTNEPNKFVILVPQDVDFEYKLIIRYITRLAAFIANKHIIVEAQQIAESLGLAKRVKSWTIGRGEQRLGCCSASGKISLSRKLAFMPPKLRRHIITHELAHLDHLNHSPQFHTLWQSYDGTQHPHLRKALKQFKFPY